MRRREKFVITSILLTLALLGVQLVALEYKYFAVLGMGVLSYFMSAWALSDDLQRFEWAVILPLPTLYAVAVGLFYFLLPGNIVSRFIILGVFGVGTYALYLTSNIYSVAKGRSIQLLHAAHAVGLLFTLITSIFFTNTIFSLRLPFYLNGLLIGVTHFPIALMSLWSVKLEQKITREVLLFSGLVTLILMEFAIGLSFMPYSDWNRSLFLMALLYIGLGILHNFLRGILFENTLREYSLVAGLVGFVFLLLFPMK
jgi:hypothetical protein